jgi:hypothetical protein
MTPYLKKYKLKKKKLQKRAGGMTQGVVPEFEP